MREEASFWVRSRAWTLCRAGVMAGGLQDSLRSSNDKMITIPWSKSHLVARPYQFTVFVSENVKLPRTRIEKASRICLLTVLTGGESSAAMFSLVKENRHRGSQHFIGLF
jgi:hypothetical protein